MAESVIGKRIPKVDSREKVTGQAIYAGDMRLPGMYYGKVVRCWEYAGAAPAARMAARPPPPAILRALRRFTFMSCSF